MQETLRHSHLPDLNRLSLLAAAILIAYALARMVNLPERTFSIQLPGIFLAPHVDAGSLVSLLVAGLTIFAGLALVIHAERAQRVDVPVAPGVGE